MNIETTGYFLKPTVIADVSSQVRGAQEEILDPLLASIPSPNLSQSLANIKTAEDGFIDSRHSGARMGFHVRNFYFNHKCAGEMGRVPACGAFHISGADSKAGGPDYLRLLSQAKSVAENFIVERARAFLTGSVRSKPSLIGRYKN